jgi:hypothetical protein
VRATSLAELGIRLSPQDLETAVESALGVALGVAWEPTALGPEEIRQARSYLPEGPPEAGNLRSAAKLRLSSAPSAGR